MTTLMKVLTAGAVGALAMSLVGCTAGNDSADAGAAGSSLAAASPEMPASASASSPLTAVASAPAETLLTAKEGTRTNRVLLVSAGSDLVDERSLMERSLCNRYAAVAPDGQAALDAAAQENFTAVVVDWRQPGITGPEFITQLRNAGRAMPIVVLLARGDDGPEARSRIRAAGAKAAVLDSSDPTPLCAVFSALVFTGKMSP